jgi:hypothetical protein
MVMLSTTVHNKLPGIWEYETASQRSFFQLLEKVQKEVAEVIFQAPSGVVQLLRKAGMQQHCSW